MSLERNLPRERTNNDRQEVYSKIALLMKGDKDIKWNLLNETAWQYLLASAMGDEENSALYKSALAKEFPDYFSTDKFYADAEKILENLREEFENLVGKSIPHPEKHENEIRNFFIKNFPNPFGVPQKEAARRTAKKGEVLPKQVQLNGQNAAENTGTGTEIEAEQYQEFLDMGKNQLITALNKGKLFPVAVYEKDGTFSDNWYVVGRKPSSNLFVIRKKGEKDREETLATLRNWCRGKKTFPKGANIVIENPSSHGAITEGQKGNEGLLVEIKDPLETTASDGEQGGGTSNQANALVAESVFETGAERNNPDLKELARMADDAWSQLDLTFRDKEKEAIYSEALAKFEEKLLEVNEGLVALKVARNEALKRLSSEKSDEAYVAYEEARDKYDEEFNKAWREILNDGAEIREPQFPPVSESPLTSTSEIEDPLETTASDGEQGGGTSNQANAPVVENVFEMEAERDERNLKELAKAFYDADEQYFSDYNETTRTNYVEARKKFEAELLIVNGRFSALKTAMDDAIERKRLDDGNDDEAEAVYEKAFNEYYEELRVLCLEILNGDAEGKPVGLEGGVSQQEGDGDDISVFSEDFDEQEDPDKQAELDWREYLVLKRGEGVFFDKDPSQELEAAYKEMRVAKAKYDVLQKKREKFGGSFKIFKSKKILIEQLEEAREAFARASEAFSDAYDREVGGGKFSDMERNLGELSKFLDQARERYALDLSDENAKTEYENALDAFNQLSMEVAGRAIRSGEFAFVSVSDEEVTDPKTGKTTKKDFRNNPLYDSERNTTRFRRFFVSKKKKEEAKGIFNAQLDVRKNDVSGANLFLEGLVRANRIGEQLKIQQILIQKEEENGGKMVQNMRDFTRWYTSLPMKERIVVGLAVSGSAAAMAAVGGATGIFSSSILASLALGVRAGFGMGTAFFSGRDAGQKKALGDWEEDKDKEAEAFVSERAKEIIASKKAEVILRKLKVPQDLFTSNLETLRDSRSRGRLKQGMKSMGVSAVAMAAGGGIGYGIHHWDGISDWFSGGGHASPAIRPISEAPSHYEYERIIRLEDADSFSDADTAPPVPDATLGVKPDASPAIPTPPNPFEIPLAETVIAPADVAPLVVETPSLTLPDSSPKSAMEDFFGDDIKYDVQKRNTVWGVLDEHAEEYLPSETSPAQREIFVDALKDKMESMTPKQLREAGISSGDIDLIRYDKDTIDFEKLLKPEDIQKALEAAKIPVEDMQTAGTPPLGSVNRIADTTFVSDGALVSSDAAITPTIVENDFPTASAVVDSTIPGVKSITTFSSAEASALFGATAIGTIEKKYGKGEMSKAITKLSLGLLGFLSVREMRVLRGKSAQEVVFALKERTTTQRRVARLLKAAYRREMGKDLPKSKKEERLFPYILRVTGDIVQNRIRRRNAHSERVRTA